METMATPGASPFLSLPPPERRRTPDHPPYAEMIQAAIRTMAEKEGSTAVAIDRYIRGEYLDLPWGHHNLLPHYLRKLVVAGEIEQNKFGRYLLPYLGVEGGTADSSSRTPKLRASNSRRNRLRKPMSSVVSKVTAMDDDGFIIPPHEAPAHLPIDMPMHVHRSHIGSLSVDASCGELSRGPVVPESPTAEAVTHEGGRDNPNHFIPEPIDSDDSFETPIITVARITELSREPRTQEDHASTLLSSGNNAVVSSEISKQSQYKTDMDDPPLLMLEEAPPESIKHGSSSKGKNKKASTEKKSFMPFTAYVEREVIIALPCSNVDMFSKKWPLYKKTASLIPPQKSFNPNVMPDEPVGSSVPPPTVPLSSIGGDAEVDPVQNDVIVIEDPVLCIPKVSGDQLSGDEPGPSPPSPTKIEALPSSYNSCLETTSVVLQDASQLTGHASVSFSKDVPQEASQLTGHGSASFSEDVPQEASQLTGHASVSFPEDVPQEVSQLTGHASVSFSGDVNDKSMKEEFFGRIRKPADLNREFKRLAESMSRPQAHTDASMLVRWKRRIRKHQTNPVVENLSRVSSDLQGAEKSQSSVPERGTSAMASSTSATVTKSVTDPNAVATSPDPVPQMASDQCDTDARMTEKYVGSWQIHFPTPTSETIASSHSQGLESEHLSSKAPPLEGTESPLATSNYDIYVKQPSSAAVSVTPTATKTTSNSGDALLPRGKRRYTKKQNNPTRLPKSVLQDSGYEQHSGVELQPSSLMSFDQCDTDVRTTGKYAGQIHVPTPASESITGGHGVFVNQPSSTAASVAVTATETSLSNSIYADASLPRGKRRYTKKQNNPTRPPKSVLEGSGYGQHGAVEVEPSSLMEDKSSSALSIETIITADIQTVGPGLPIPSTVYHPGIKQLPSGLESNDSGRPLKRARKRTSIAAAVDNGISGQEVATESQSVVLTVEEWDLSKDAFRTPAASGYQEHGGVESEPLPMIADKCSPAFPTQTIVSADKQTVGPEPLSSKVDLPAMKQLPPGTEISDTPLRRGRGRPPKKKPNCTSIAKTVNDRISQQEVVTNPQSMVLMVEEVSQSEDVTTSLVVSGCEQQVGVDLSKDATRTTSASGYQQHGGVESEPLPMMADKFSTAFPTQTIAAADKETVGPESLSSKVDLPATKQLPPGTEIIGTPLRRGRGRPPKKKPDHTPITKTVDDRISQQEVVTNPHVTMALAVSGCEQQGGVDLSKHATRTPSTSSYQQLGGVDLEPLPMMPAKCSPAFPTQTIVAADKQTFRLEPLSSKVDLLATKQLPPGTEISDTPLRRGRGRPPKKKTDHTPIAKTVDDHVSLQEVVTNPESMVLMVEEANQSEDVTMTLVSGCEQQGGVEPEPLLVMSDVPSSSLLNETVLVEDIPVRGPPLSSEMDLLMINQLPSGIESSDTTLPKRRGRPPKRKIKHTPVAKTVDMGISEQEVATNSQPKVLMVEEGNLPEDAPRTPAVAGSQQHGGVASEPLPISVVLPSETVVAADNQMVEREQPSPLKVELLVTKQLPSGTESSDAAVQRRQWKHSRETGKHNPKAKTKTKDIDISGQEVLRNSNSVLLMVEGDLAEDASRTPSASTSTEMLPIKSRGRGRPLKNPGAPKKAESPKTFVRLQSLLNLRSRTGGRSPASPAEREFPYNDGYSKPLLLCDHDKNSDKFSSFTCEATVNSQSLLQVEEPVLSSKDSITPATGTGSSMPKHNGTPPKISSDVYLSTPTTPNDLANERSLRKLRRRARCMPLEFSSKNDTALDSASVLQSHQGKSALGSSEIPATPKTRKLLSACSRGRGRPRKQKLEVLDEAAFEIASHKHYGGCSKENPEVMYITNGEPASTPHHGKSSKEKLDVSLVTYDGLSLSKLEKSQVPDGANNGLSLKRGRGRPRKDKTVLQNSANKVILNQKETPS